MALQKSKKFIIVIIGLIFLAGIIFLSFNEYGIVKYIKLNNQVAELNEKIKAAEQENRRLQAEIDSL
ncbi:MAG TPA: septum formation initiator family protein [Ignavibacteriaceae bacterium]